MTIIHVTQRDMATRCRMFQRATFIGSGPTARTKICGVLLPITSGAILRFSNLNTLMEYGNDYTKCSRSRSGGVWGA